MKKINVLINCKWILIDIKRLIERLRENQAIGTIYIVLTYENVIFNKDIMIHNNAVNLDKCKERFPNCEFIVYRNAYVIDSLIVSFISRLDNAMGFLSTIPVKEFYDFDIDNLNNIDSVGAFASNNRYPDGFKFTTQAVEQGLDIYGYFTNLFKDNDISIVYNVSQNHYLSDYMLEKAAIDSDCVSRVIHRRDLGFSDTNMRRFCLIDSKYKTILKSLNYFKENNAENISMYRDAGQISEKRKPLQEMFSVMTSYQLYRVVKFELYKRLYFFPFYLKGLKAFYDKLCTTPCSSDKYVLFPLHFEPESTISPSDGINALQLYNLKILRSVLPEGWKIYVKEHPTQFNEKAYTMEEYVEALPQYKNKRFYKYISEINDVYLIRMEFNQKALIEGSQIVTSNSGSVFMEASSCNKPCLAFGKNAFASMFSNVWTVHNINDCKKAIQEIINSTEIKTDYIEVLNNYSMQSPKTDCPSEPITHLLKELID